MMTKTYEDRVRELGLEILDFSASAETTPRPRAYARRTGDTVAIVTADSDGNWVSLIQSAFHAFGSGVLDPGTESLLHNRGASFSLRPGAANELAPGRKPPHTLLPVLARREGS